MKDINEDNAGNERLGAKHLFDRARDLPLKIKIASFDLRMADTYKDPVSLRFENISDSWLWTLLFGAFYLFYKKAWVWGVVACVLSVITAGLAWFIFPFYAKEIIAKSYLDQGWEPVYATK